MPYSSSPSTGPRTDTNNVCGLLTLICCSVQLCIRSIVFFAKVTASKNSMSQAAWLAGISAMSDPCTCAR